jgi:cytochrome P450
LLNNAHDILPVVKTDPPPGPRGYPFIGVLHKMWRDPLGFFADAARRYGDIVQIDFGSSRAFLLNHPDLIRYVLQDNNNNYRKSTSVRVVNRVLGRGLATAEREDWFQQRRLMQPGFHRQRIADMADLMTGEIKAMLARWESLAGRGQPVDLSQEMVRLTLHITFKTMFSATLGEDIDELGRAWTIVLKHFNDQSWSLLQIPEKWPTPGNRRFERALRLLEDTVYRTIAERRESGREAADLLSLLLHAQDEETGIGMSDQQVRDEVMTLFVAGHETTGNALTWAFHLLAQNPPSRQRLRDELRQVLNGRTPGVADLPNLPYTRMVFDETLRLYPPFWLIYRAAYEEDIIGGYRLAPDDMVMICPSVMHRHPGYWEAPDAFKPERFENAPPRFVYFPFGAGPHQCIGNSFALMEAQLVLANVVQRFDLRAVAGSRVEAQALVTLRPKHGLPMTLHSL